MDEKLNTMVGPHAPLPFLYSRNEDQLEVDPVWIDAIVNSRIGLNPIAIDISRIWLLCTEAAVEVDLLNPSRPKGLDGGTKPRQQPAAPRGVNPRRFVISSNVARSSPGGNAPVLGSNAGIKLPPSCQRQQRVSTFMLSSLVLAVKPPPGPS